MLLGRYQAGFHCHVREGSREDLASLARMIAGRAISPWCSPVAARVVSRNRRAALRSPRRACRWTFFAGASMGSIIGAAAAMEWDREAEMLASLCARLRPQQSLE